MSTETSILPSETSALQSNLPGDEFVRDIDRIVISSLKNAGYAIEWENKRLRNYNFEEIVNMVIFCLRQLFPERNFPESLPFGMQNRYRLSTQLMEAVQSLNYTGETGYHIFMYNNKEPIRNIIIFLSDQLSRSENSSSFRPKEIGKKLNIKRKVKDVLKESLSKKDKECHVGLTTSPFISFPLETGIILPAQKINCKPIEWKEFVVQKLPYVDDQLPSDKCFLPSVVALNATGLYFPKRTKNTNISSSSLRYDCFKLGDSKSTPHSILRTLHPVQDAENESASNENVERVVHLSETEKAVIEVEKKVTEIQPRVEKMSSELKEAKSTTEKLQKLVTDKLSQQSALEHSLNLLPNSSENKEKLRNIIEKSKEKILSLESQTNDHKVVLLKKLGELKKVEEEKLVKRNKLSEVITQIRADVFSVVEQIEQRKILYDQLERRAQSIQGEDRGVHVQRIFKFIENLKKQETEILKIISDMREVQKAINTESERADRCFVVASQFFKDHISSDNLCAKAHQLLLTVHKLIADIIQVDTERVNLEKAVAQLEYELLNHETPVTDALKDIQVDLHRLKSEVAETESSIKRKEKELRKLLEINKENVLNGKPNGNSGENGFQSPGASDRTREMI